MQPEEAGQEECEEAAQEARKREHREQRKEELNADQSEARIRENAESIVSASTGVGGREGRLRRSKNGERENAG